MRTFIALTIVALTLGINAWADTVYTWTDKDGVVHMTNYPPPTGYTEKTAITSPEETQEEKAFRARQKAAMDRMEADFKKKDNRQTYKESTPAPPVPSRAESAEDRRARIRQEITDLEVKEKRYHSLSKRAYSDSDRQYWYQQQKAAQAEIDSLKRELTR